MKKDNEVTEVIFRKYKPRYNSGVSNVILAVFPYEIYNSKGNVISYEFCGQHSEADYFHVINTMTTPATEEESLELKKHLEKDFGYNFKVIKKRSHNKFLDALKLSRELV